MLRDINDSVKAIKPGHQTSENTRDVVRWVVVLHAVPCVRKSLRMENTQSGMPVQTVKHRGDSVMVWEAISCYYVTVLSFMAELLQGNTWTGSVHVHVHVHSIIHPSFPNNDAVFWDEISRFTQLELFIHWLKSMKMNFNIFPGQHAHHKWTSLKHLGQFWRLEWGTYYHLRHLQSNFCMFFKNNYKKFS
jgi:hypothetical protein